MYDESLAGVYDLLYTSSGKDYRSEATDIAELIRQRHPNASSLLDVACGTGLHLQQFQQLFDHVEGVELSEAMRSIASARLPDVTIHLADMRGFDLGTTFSAVTCLFSSIGYMQSAEELQRAVAAMAAHLQPDGVLVLEPWFTPDQWEDGLVRTTFAEADGRHLVRMSYSERDGNTSRMTMTYTLGEQNVGVRTWTDEHLMTLFTTTEYEQALATAGLVDIAWMAGWRKGRDRIVASKPST